MPKCNLDVTIPIIRKCSMIILTFASIIAIFVFIISLTIKHLYKVNIVNIEINQPPIHVTSDKYLSIALDSFVICNGFLHFDIKNPKLSKLMKHLAPGYLRIGGNLADRLVFTERDLLIKYYFTDYFDGGDCSNYFDCNKSLRPNYTMTGKEWLRLHNMITSNGFEIVFDLNVLKRFPNNTWDYRNAELLISFSQRNNLMVHWELGNEPNAFKHQFQVVVSPEQLAADFNTLHNILQKYPLYKKSLLIGPDVTRPREEHKQSIAYLASFLKNGGSIVNVVSFHQYYYSGSFVRPFDFVDTSCFRILEWQIREVEIVLNTLNLQNKTLWIGETADCWGGGAPGLSDTFISTYIWLYKLGVVAKMGVDVVVRQSIVEGYYALLDYDYNPTPNWWLSLFYKKLVGTKVLSCTNMFNKQMKVYCHCAGKDFYNSVVVFAFNVGSVEIKLRFEGVKNLEEKYSDNEEIKEYILSPSGSIFSKELLFNGKVLHLDVDNEIPFLTPKIIRSNAHVILPAYCIGFWIIKINGDSPCSSSVISNSYTYT